MRQMARSRIEVGFRNKFSAVFATLLALATFAKAQLVGCQELHCPTSTNGHFCPLGNHTSFALGTTSFITSFNAAPLTWTVGLESIFTNNASEYRFERAFFLGVPHDIDLSSSQLSYQGCALFIDGPSRNLSFPGADQGAAVGDCDDALGKQCRLDLQSQVVKNISELSSSTNSTSEACSALASRLQDSPPRSCTKGVQNGSWGSIRPRALTGPDAAPDIALSTCSPTTGKKYAVSLVETINEASKRLQPELAALLHAVTPVITVFYSNPANENETTAGFVTEVHSNCMKVVQRTVPEAANSASTVGVSILTLIVGILAAFF